MPLRRKKGLKNWSSATVSLYRLLVFIWWTLPVWRPRINSMTRTQNRPPQNITPGIMGNFADNWGFSNDHCSIVRFSRREKRPNQQKRRKYSSDGFNFYKSQIKSGADSYRSKRRPFTAQKIYREIGSEAADLQDRSIRFGCCAA